MAITNSMNARTNSNDMVLFSIVDMKYLCKYPLSEVFFAPKEPIKSNTDVFKPAVFSQFF